MGRNTTVAKLFLSRLLSLLVIITVVLAGLGLSGIKGVKSKSRAFFGLHGEASNNFDFASSRYGVVAPFAPSPDGNGFIPEELDQMDNHFVYIFDTKKPKNDPIAADLKYCYYPSQAYFDEKRNVVLVRGIEYVEPQGQDPYIGDVLIHLGLNLETETKPYFEDSTVTPLRIERPTYGYDGEAPNSFHLGYDGNIVVLTNGEAIITINRSEGYHYPVYFTGQKITYLDYNDSARLITVGLSKVETLENGSCSYSSELRFYELESTGVINLKVRLRQEEFPKDVGVLPGTQVVFSNYEVVNDRVQSFRAYFPSSDGSVWSVDFQDGASTSGLGDVVKFTALGFIPEIGESECEQHPSPRSLVYDSANRTLTIIKRGPSQKIIRPSFVRKPRGIIRPSFVGVRSDPAIAIIQFDKRGNWAGYKVFKRDFEGKGGLSNILLGDELSYIATYDGDLFSLDLRTGTEGILTKLGRLTSRVSYISQGSEDGVFVGIISFEMNADGQVTGLGSLVIGKPQGF